MEPVVRSGSQANQFELHQWFPDFLLIPSDPDLLFNRAKSTTSSLWVFAADDAGKTGSRLTFVGNVYVSIVSARPWKANQGCYFDPSIVLVSILARASPGMRVDVKDDIVVQLRSFLLDEYSIGLNSQADESIEY